MSTQVNITISDGGLVNKVKDLQAAARQAQLEKERQQRIETQGQQQRTANLAAAGRAPDGSPLYGARFEQPQIDRRPAANRFGGKGLLVAGKTAAYGETGLPALSSFGGSTRFGLFAAPADDFANFDVAAGPAPGTMSLIGPNISGVDPYGFCFASNFVDSLDLQSVLAEADNDDPYLGDLDLPSGPVASPSALANSSSKASNYNSFTFEFLLNPPSNGDLDVATHNIRFDMSFGPNTSSTTLRISGITSFSSITGDSDPGDDEEVFYGLFEDDTGIRGASGEWNHVAYCKDQDQIRIYINGILIVTCNASSRYWNRYVEFERPGSSDVAVLNGNLPVMFSVVENVDSRTAPLLLHGIRWSPKALYTGNTFTPLASITKLI